MKNFSLLSAVIAVMLTVTAVSCTTAQGGYDDEYYSTYDRRTPNRVYVDDPYYGTVVLERDPYSGRYYQISPYGYSYRNNTRYNKVYSRNRNNYYYRNNQNTNTRNNQGQTEQQKKDWEKQRNEARKKVLGE
jgi:hypothetical protein